MLLVVLDTKAAWLYLRIKRTTDTYLGVVSQCQSIPTLDADAVPNKPALGCHLSQVLGNRQEYCSNVAMKFNAKLGGTTSRIAGVRGPSQRETSPPNANMYRLELFPRWPISCANPCYRSRCVTRGCRTGTGLYSSHYSLT